MTLIIYDCSEESALKFIPATLKDCTIIAKKQEPHCCIGCFGCWIKTPGACTIHDGYDNIGELLSKAANVIIISKCVYGSFSPFVKNILDRGISYIHPYFVVKNNELHHRRRYDNNISITVWFYGDNITDNEKSTAEKIVHANSVNFEVVVKNISFVTDLSEIGGHLDENCIN